MKKINRIIKYIGITAITCLAFTACGNTVLEPTDTPISSDTPVVESVETTTDKDISESQAISISGTIDLTGAAPRSATSSFSQTITWIVNAVSDDYQAEHTADGQSKVTQGAIAVSTSTQKAFSLSLSKTGKWIIYVSGFSGDYTASEIPAGISPLFNGNTEITVTEQGLSNLKIPVSFTQTGTIPQEQMEELGLSDPIGTIRLAMSAPSSIGKVHAVLTKYQTTPAYTKEKEAVYIKEL